MLRFVSLNQSRQHIKAIIFGGVRRGIKKTLDFGKRRLVICFSSNGSNLHLVNLALHTVAALIRSYSWCVPTKRMYTMPSI